MIVLKEINAATELKVVRTSGPSSCILKVVVVVELTPEVCVGDVGVSWAEKRTAGKPPENALGTCSPISCELAVGLMKRV
ncbi:MAG: hypothetical protein WKF37_03170 [Bryobacteraceae bacterium]